MLSFVIFFRGVKTFSDIWGERCLVEINQKTAFKILDGFLILGPSA